MLLLCQKQSKKLRIFLLKLYNSTDAFTQYQRSERNFTVNANDVDINNESKICTIKKENLQCKPDFLGA